MVRGIDVILEETRQKSAKRRKITDILLGVITGLLAVAFVLMLVMMHAEAKERARQRAELDEQRAGYTMFLDGREVDNSTIDFHLYNYTVDDKNQVIFMSSN